MCLSFNFPCFSFVHRPCDARRQHLQLRAVKPAAMSHVPQSLSSWPRFQSRRPEPLQDTITPDDYLHIPFASQEDCQQHSDSQFSIAFFHRVRPAKAISATLSREMSRWVIAPSSATAAAGFHGGCGCRFRFRAENSNPLVSSFRQHRLLRCILHAVQFHR